jgi:drug/metabolite transporter (DMT)-like permease
LRRSYTLGGVRFVRWLTWRGKLILGSALCFAGGLGFLLGTPSFLIRSKGPTYDLICGGVHGMDQSSGRALLIGTGCAVVGPLLVALGVGLLGRRRAVLVWVGLAVAMAVGLALTSVSTPGQLRTAVHVQLHPPPHEPGVRPDRMGICAPH